MAFSSPLAAGLRETPGGHGAAGRPAWRDCHGPRRETGGRLDCVGSVEALRGGESLEVETDWMAARLGPICFGKTAPAVSRGFPDSAGVPREPGPAGALWLWGPRVEATVQRGEAEPG